MTAVLEIAGLSKDYRALRPLRIQQLTVASGDLVALLGFDQMSAEVFVNLVTGATLPDAGSISVFGRPTAAISNSDDWLALVDRFGIVSARAVLLEQMTVLQNLAMPFSLDIEPPSDDVRQRAASLAAEVGLPEAACASAVATIDDAAKARVRLGRAIALDPAVLLLEHASAGLDPAASRAFAAAVRSVAMKRGIAAIAVTADEQFARAVAPRVFRLDAATGRLADVAHGWIRRLLG